MLTINEICDKTGITLHTFQSWRRNGLKLLPKPVAVDKKVIFFDDSILDRIQIIRKQKAAGRKIREISGTFESCDALAVSLAASGNEPDHTITALADTFAKLATYEATLQTLLDDHKRHMQDLFQNFQALMADAAHGLPDDGDR